MLIYSFCRYSLCLSHRSRGVFTRRWLFSESKSNLLLRLVMGTNMKITESRESIDFETADGGPLHTQRISSRQINTITCSKREWERNSLCAAFFVQARLVTGEHQCTEDLCERECWLKLTGSGWLVQILTSTFVGAEMIISVCPFSSCLFLCVWHEQHTWQFPPTRRMAFIQLHILFFFYMSESYKENVILFSFPLE